MLVPMHWLKQYVSTTWSASELAKRLTATGLEVASVQKMGAGVGGIITARILTVRPHPQAERLVICDLDTGSGNCTVVTGATNVAVGQIVPLALPGANLYGSTKPVSTAAVRGVDSNGVLCAEDELGISDDHSGIMILPPETSLGIDVAELLHLGDEVLEIDLYPNRPDCQSVVGIAAEVAALAQVKVTRPPTTPTEAGLAAVEQAEVEVLAPDLCPRYCARIIRGVRIGTSPIWMQQRLRAAGMRPINNVVDITNYVMLELGQPLHAFDLNLIKGRRIVVRRALANERIHTLDGQDRQLDSETLVIADDERAVAIAGIMGGENSEVTADTQDILLESAIFSQVSVRKTARRLGLHSEASHRFEKGLDPYLALEAVNRAALLLAELCAGTVSPGVIDVKQPLPEPLQIQLRTERVNKLLGTELTKEQIADYLGRLEFEVSVAKDGFIVGVPTYRKDVIGEADLIEEVARMHTYDKIPATMPAGAATPGGQSKELEIIDRMRSTCVAAGLSECITYSFTSPRHADLLRLPADDFRRNAIRLVNPLSEELSVMRTTLMGNMLDALSRNVAHQNNTVHLFELGATFIPNEWPPQNQPAEKKTLCIALIGTAPGSGWGEKERLVDFYDLKSILERIAMALRLELHVRRGQHPSMHPGRTGEICLGEKAVGHLGQVHPLVQAAYNLPTPAYLLELDLEQLLLSGGQPIHFKSLGRFPALQRDLALLVPISVTAAQVEQVLREQTGDMLEQLRLFDVYQGPQVPSGYRSLAYSLTFRVAERTLTDVEVNTALNNVEEALAAIGVKLRR
jgi:phenylalanyl-tRNA synthetase beta chain